MNTLPLPKTRIAWVIAGVSLLVVLIVAMLLALPREIAVNPVDVSALPALNALLNAATALLLAAAYWFIRHRQIRRHRFCMLSAFSLSVLFLVCYVIYHALAGSTRFAGPDAIRPLYYFVLFSHVVLAALVLPLALTTLYRGLRSNFVQHRRIARWTLPIWLYVSMSGVLVYVLLYHIR
jgi:putative membrane protein